MSVYSSRIEDINGVKYLSKQCEIIFNTKWGYCMKPVKCKSIADAVRTAKETEMAFRIIVDRKCVKTGWY